MITVEPCPPALAHVEQPQYGGSLFFRQDTGLAGCPKCGWSGIPTHLDDQVPAIRNVGSPDEVWLTSPEMVPGYASTWCPACTPLPPLAPTRVPRNVPCPCRSGAKAKRCACVEYTV